MKRLAWARHQRGVFAVSSALVLLVLSHLPAGCTSANCTMVQGQLSDLQVRLLLPVSALSLSLPVYRHPQIRQSMSNVAAGEFNLRCTD